MRNIIIIILLGIIAVMYFKIDIKVDTKSEKYNNTIDSTKNIVNKVLDSLKK
jgi:hypothetical protein